MRSSNFTFPASLSTPRLTLELMNYTPAHYECLLACLNSPTAYASMGDFGIRTPADIDHLLSRTRLRRSAVSDLNLSEHKTQPRSIDADDEFLEQACYYLIRLRADCSDSASDPRYESPLIGGVSLSQRDKQVPPDMGWCLLDHYVRPCSKPNFPFLWTNIDLHVNSLMMKQQGRGYATEAASSLLSSIQSLGICEVMAWPGPRNHPSIRVAKKIGLVEGGHVRDLESGEMQIVYVVPGMRIEGVPGIYL